MSDHILQGLLVVLLLALAVVFVVTERRLARRAGRRPRTALFVLAASFAAFAVIAGAGLVLSLN